MAASKKPVPRRRFRGTPGGALLLPRGGFGKRLPLWLNRLRSKKLLDTVMVSRTSPYSWRPGAPACATNSIRQPEIAFERGNAREKSPCRRLKPRSLPLRRRLDLAADQYLHVPGRHTESEGRSRLNDDLLREIASSPGLRPDIPPR